MSIRYRILEAREQARELYRTAQYYLDWRGERADLKQRIKQLESDVRAYRRGIDLYRAENAELRAERGIQSKPWDGHKMGDVGP
jgi:hypothetical protein